MKKQLLLGLGLAIALLTTFASCEQKKVLPTPGTAKSVNPGASARVSSYSGQLVDYDHPCNHSQPANCTEVTIRVPRKHVDDLIGYINESNGSGVHDVLTENYTEFTELFGDSEVDGVLNGTCQLGHVHSTTLNRDWFVFTFTSQTLYQGVDHE